MLDTVDTVFSYEGELIVCSFLPAFSKGKGNSLQLICNAHTVFLLCGAEFTPGAMPQHKFCLTCSHESAWAMLVNVPTKTE